MLFPINKEQLQKLLTQTKGMMYIFNGELILQDLISPHIEDKEHKYLIYNIHTNNQLLKIKYEHISDILIDTRENHIVFKHEHEEIFPEKWTIAAMFIHPVNFFGKLNKICNNKNNGESNANN